MAVQNRGIDQKGLIAEVYKRGAVIGRQVWSRHHGPNRANRIEPNRREESMECGCARPACGASAEFQPRFKEVLRLAAGQRSRGCGANVDELADIVERNSLAPGAVEAAKRVNGWNGTTFETQARENAFDELLWQRLGRNSPDGLSKMTYGH